MSARQTFHTVDRLRVEVQEPWTDLPNYVEPALGYTTAAGWIGTTPATLDTPPGGGIRITRHASEGGGALVNRTAVSPPIPVAAGGAGLWERAKAVRVSGPATRTMSVRIGLFTATGLAVLAGGAGSNVTADGAVSEVAPQEVDPLGYGTGAYLRVIITATLAADESMTVTDPVLVLGPSEAAVTAATMALSRDWREVTGSVRELTIERDELQVGVTTASLVGADLDPATVDLLRPGRGIRAAAFIDDEWEPIAPPSTILTAKAGYDLKTKGIPDAKRSRVEITAADELSRLANTPRPSGVATIDELPYVLEGAGVPWNVNGFAGGVSSDDVTVVSTVEAATAVDQVAITRDTVRGYAWLDRHGVLQAWDADQLDATVVDVLDETTYSEAAIDFDSERCINTATIKLLAVDAEGATQETAYGPYVDSDSVREWGPRSAEFTVHGLDVDDLDDYAAGILAAAATPAVKVNEVTLPLRTTAELEAHVLRDLYDLVTVSNARAGLDQDLRVVSVKHRITSGANSGACRWFIDLSFAADSSVAPPQVTPSPAQPTAATLAARLRPVGEVTMWWGAAVDCPAGWLICDGTPFNASDYPALAALLGGTSLPNMVDRFPIGAGVKALGDAGGSATRSLSVANLPDHVHEIPRASAVGSAGRVAQGSGATVADQNTTGTTGATGTAFSIVPPYRALHFIIRAR